MSNQFLLVPFGGMGGGKLAKIIEVTNAGTTLATAKITLLGPELELANKTYENINISPFPEFAAVNDIGIYLEYSSTNTTTGASSTTKYIHLNKQAFAVFTDPGA